MRTIEDFGQLSKRQGHCISLSEESWFTLQARKGFSLFLFLSLSEHIDLSNDIKMNEIAIDRSTSFGGV